MAHEKREQKPSPIEEDIKREEEILKSITDEDLSQLSEETLKELIGKANKILEQKKRIFG